MHTPRYTKILQNTDLIFQDFGAMEAAHELPGWLCATWLNFCVFKIWWIFTSLVKNEWPPHGFGKNPMEALPVPRTHVVKTLQQLELQRLQRTFNAWKQRRMRELDTRILMMGLTFDRCPLIMLAGWVFDSVCRDLTGLYPSIYLPIYPYISGKSTTDIWSDILHKRWTFCQASPPTTGCWHVAPWLTSVVPWGPGMHPCLSPDPFSLKSGRTVTQKRWQPFFFDVEQYLLDLLVTSC